MNRHATDRVDFSYIGECAGECDIEITATGTNSDVSPKDAFPFDECPGCGGEWTVIVDEQPTEVLE